MDFKQKYLKYKEKYLNLKNQKGGDGRFLTVSSLDQLTGDLSDVTSLSFRPGFNQPLGTSLQGLKNLRRLKFYTHFNQPLGTSLQGLEYLEFINFGQTFNQPLGTSLQGLTSLSEIQLSNNYNQPLGYSLQNLPSLSFKLDLDKLKQKNGIVKLYNVRQGEKLYTNL